MGGRWVGAAVAGVLVFGGLGGAVAGAAPASAAAPVRVAGAVRTVPERAPGLRSSAGVHQVAKSALSKAKKRTSHRGSHGGGGRLFSWTVFGLLCCLPLAVSAVVRFRRRSRRRPREG